MKIQRVKILTADFLISVIQCPSYVSPTNGYILTGICPTYYGATCMIGCNRGFKLSDTTSNGQISCNVDNNQRPLWTGQGLSCQGRISI